ncbi:hypothetical protein TNCV_1125111 [Trichonephila clavipes]|uniref:Uncharacterized protein n=1 Tax=Trichonephila clavipes TaxID=2585209 RepID=A0A8X6SGG7_TRICX|nr:hypothetical protein TNCV_1125111 [Trichonephila clavipes]
MRPCIVIHKNEVWANGTSEQMRMGEKYLLTIAIPDYRPSIENVELSSPVQHNASPDKNSRTIVMVSSLMLLWYKTVSRSLSKSKRVENRFWY